jgi:hypothetical protein
MSPPLPPLIQGSARPGTLSAPGGGCRADRDAYLVAAARRRLRLQDQEGGRPALPRLRYARAAACLLRGRTAPQPPLCAAALPGRACRSLARPKTRRSAAAGEAIEYAVRMRRFAEDGRLDRLCARGQLRTTAGLRSRSHARHFPGRRRQPPRQQSPFGEPKRVVAPALANFDELRDAAARRRRRAARLARLRDVDTAPSSTACQTHFAARKADRPDSRVPR